MKRTKKIWSIVLVICMIASVGLFAGGQKESKTPAGTGGYAKTEYNLVFIPKLVHQWYEDVKDGIDIAVAELAEKGITVNYTWDAPADAVVTEQIAKLEAAATNDPDGISVAIIDPAATTDIIDELVDMGFNVSTFDCDAPDSKRMFYCGHSKNFDDGVKMAEIMAEAIGEKGEVAVLAGTLAAANHQERVKGFVAGMDKYPGITVVDTQADEDSIETAISVTESYLTAYPNLKGIFGSNDAAPIGAVRAIKDAGKAGEIKIVGFADSQEGMGYIKDGSLLCTMKQEVVGIGYNSVYNMLLIADGKAPEKVEYELDAIFITAADVDKYIK